MMVLYIDNPNGYICRLNQSEMMEILDNEDLSSVLLVLAAVLNLKSSVEETIKAAQIKQSQHLKRLVCQDNLLM